MFFHKKPPHRAGCLTFHVLATVLLFLATVASFVGLLMAHFDATDNTLVFGTSPASLSIIAFAVSITMLAKLCKSVMSECGVCAMPPPAKKR